MEEKRTGLFENGLIWFGAGVSTLQPVRSGWRRGGLSLRTL